MAWHRPQLSALVSGGADLIAIDTIPALKEARALSRLLEEEEFKDVKAWLSFSCKVGVTLVIDNIRIMVF